MATPSARSRKNVLDEDSFQKLLAAAFVVQEHKLQTAKSTDSQSAASSTLVDKDVDNDILEDTRPAYAYVMEEIVATQHQIQTRRLKLQQAMDLIVERVLPIAHAQGAAIALLEGAGDELVYRAAVGRSAGLVGQRIKKTSALCSESVLTGTTVQCTDIATDFRVNAELSQQRGARGLISVPVYRDEVIAGALELVFAKAGSFLDHDVRTCQLMAGMVTEALDRAADIEFKQALVNERATMLDALEKLKPQLERLVDPRGSKTASENGKSSICSGCGASVAEHDLHCGHCGARRDSTTRSDAQSVTASKGLGNTPSPVADTDVTNDNPASEKRSGGLLKAPARPNTLPDSQQLEETELEGEDQYEIPSSVIDDLEASLRDYDPDRAVASSDSETQPVAPEPDALQSSETTQELATVPQEELRITPVSPPEDTWTSASKAKAWLESVADPSFRAGIIRFLNRRRAEIYLGMAILAVAIAVWFSAKGPSLSEIQTSSNATNSTDSPAARRRARKAPESDLTMFERMLVAIGLAEAPPPAAVYVGNPDVKVWVDLQTALYYCPNAQLYGKTPSGKFTTQHDAQLDQFEPAYRKACD